MTVELFLGNCLEVMQQLPPKSIDAIITDLPYGTTACKWDIVIPFDKMWVQVKRLLKTNGVFVTTSGQPFTSLLICSNLDWFKYCWTWDKIRPVGHLVAKYRPMQQTEDIVVFGCGRTNYYPIMEASNVRVSGESARTSIIGGKKSKNYKSKIVDEKYPKTVLTFQPVSREESMHPTQKPLLLYEYLIKTYTNTGDTVLDFCMGSGTTGEACVKTGRKFIGIEIIKEYFYYAEKRIYEAAGDIGDFSHPLSRTKVRNVNLF